jgi:hypothetical protein
VAAVTRDPSVGELRLYSGGNLLDPTEPNTRITLNGEPRALKVFEFASTGPQPDAGSTQNQDAGAVDVRQYAWVLLQVQGNLVAECYNLSSRALAATANIGPFKAVDMTVGTRLFPAPPVPDGGTIITNGTSTAFLHVLVQAE